MGQVWLGQVWLDVFSPRSLIVCLVLAQVLQLASSVSRTEFLQAMLTDYDSRIPPSYSAGQPTNVTVDLRVRTIHSIDEATMDFSAHFFLTQQWTDHRLMFFGLIDAPYLELDSKFMDSVWVPDLYFANEKEAHFHHVTVPNKMMHLYQDGTVIYRARVSIKASCPMVLHKYPMDTQICHVELRSFAYSQSNVVFRWKDEMPIIVSSTLKLPQFSLDDYSAGECAYDPYEGNFSCIQATFYLKRELGYYMIQLYIPSVLIVSLSWVSFWLSADAVPARISLGILTVLTMTTQKSAGNTSLPKVSYVKAIDVWMALCLTFVFAALLEYALVNVLLRKNVKSQHRRETLTQMDVEKNSEMKTLTPNSCGKRTWTSRIFGEKQCQNTADLMDRISRVLFPLSFGIFCLVYWCFYLR